jgi:MFS family permease
MEIIKGYIRTISGFHGNVKLLLLRSFVICLYTGIYGILFNLYILNLGYGADFLGLVLATHVLASSAMSIPAGILCDRFDKKKLMIISGLLSMLSAIPLYLYSSPLSLLFFSIAGGVFVSVSSVTLTPLLAENCRKDDTVHVFSANASISWIASVAGCALGGILPGMWGSFPGLRIDSLQLTLLSSVVLLAMGLVIMFMVKEKEGDAKCRCSSFSLKGFRFSPDVIKFTLTSLTFGVASGMIVPYFNVYFTKALHVGVLEVGMASAVAGAVMILGFITTPYLTSKIGKVRSAVVTKTIAAPFLLLMALTESFILAAAAYVAYMFFINMAGPATTSFQMEQIKPREQGFAVGMMMTGNYIAVSASTYLSGLLIARGNYIIPFIGTCAFYLVTAVLLYHYFKDVERPIRLPISMPVPKAAFTTVLHLD